MSSSSAQPRRRFGAGRPVRPIAAGQSASPSDAAFQSIDAMPITNLPQGGSSANDSSTGFVNRLGDLEALLSRNLVRSPSPPAFVDGGPDGAAAAVTHAAWGAHEDSLGPETAGNSSAASPLVHRQPLLRAASSSNGFSDRRGNESNGDFGEVDESAGESSSHHPSFRVGGSAHDLANATPRGQGTAAVRSLRSTPRRSPAAAVLDDREEEDESATSTPPPLGGHSAPASFAVASSSGQGSPRRSDGGDATATATDAAAGLDVPHDMRCPVCLDAFRDPVTLGCYHNVCRAHVRDLAATRGRRPDDAPGAIALECPKCRQTTSFADADSIRVNTEMKAIVDMMLNMLRQQQAMATQQRALQQLSTGATPPTTTPRYSDEVVSGAPKTPPSRGSGAKHARVRFVVDDGAATASGPDDGDDSAVSSARTPSAVKSALSHKRRHHGGGAGASSGGDSSGDETAATPSRTAAASGQAALPVGHRQAQKLADLEKELEAKRQQMVAERERRNREATEEFKRARIQEIQSRRAVIAAVDHDAASDPLLRKPVALRLAAGEHVPIDQRAFPPAAGEDGDVERRFRAQEAAFLAAKREREKAKDAERETREKEVRDALQEWLKEDRSSFDTEAETNEFANKLQQASTFMAGRAALTESVTRDAMRQAAEQRLPPMPDPPRVRPSTSPSPSTSNERLMQAPFKDIEVELRLLESEREVQREVDDALSRAEMAAIAERRARETVERFRRQEQRDRPWSKGAVGAYEPQPLPTSSSNSPAAGPGYKPKLSRLRRIM